MKYLSVCSGIEAATVAWHPLGWQAVGYSEIEKFPSQVLAHHYPDVTNYGDMTKFKEWSIDSTVDLLVGGTPCQSFSVAGLRKGLDDPRGNLMLTYLAIADKFKPKWLVWENVPGVLSSNSGKDFGVFLGALGELGYGFAYRILDAQYFGVAQRRRRVFVVGYFGDWRSAAAVLFERHSLSGDPAPSRQKREDPAKCLTRGTGQRYDFETEDLIAQPIVVDRAAFNQGANAQYKFRAEHSETMDSLVARGPHAVLQPIPIHDQATRHAGKNGNKTMGKGNGLGVGHSGEPMNTLTQGDRHAVAQPKAYLSARGVVRELNDVMSTLDAARESRGTNQQRFLMQQMAVRRLTPIECERLQGFGDNYTDIQPKGKPTPDGPRYKALGNSMAVPVMAWIGKRIQEVERLSERNG